MNGLSIDEMTSNLLSMFETCSSSESTVPLMFLCEEEVLEILKAEQAPLSTALTQNVNPKFEFQQPLAVVWDDAAGKQWFIGFVISEESNTLVVDYLERKNKDDNKTWQRPLTDDTQTVNIVQIVPCVVRGEWNFSTRTPLFILENSEDVASAFQEHWK